MVREFLCAFLRFSQSNLLEKLLTLYNVRSRIASTVNKPRVCCGFSNRVINKLFDNILSEYKYKPTKSLLNRRKISRKSKLISASRHLDLC